MSEKVKVTNAKAIQEFFSKDGGRAVTMIELRALSSDERAQIGADCARELGVEIAAS